MHRKTKIERRVALVTGVCYLRQQMNHANCECDGGAVSIRQGDGWEAMNRIPIGIRSSASTQYDRNGLTRLQDIERPCEGL